ncbi:MULTISPECIES: hypothetical protein [Actinoplanes]|uniref:hypothetical protein n=1 Tax=Actinoplanes TaxID=1865 RepID=UPI0012F954FC|nr:MULTISPECIES: hypothetical protein [Actinoplanes]
MSKRKVLLSGAAAVAFGAGILGVVPAASADDSPNDNNLIGPVPKSCQVAGKNVDVKVWLRWKPQSTDYRVDRLWWDADFTAAKLTVTSRTTDGSDIDDIRSWGGTTATEHDVAAKGDTGHNWEQTWHKISHNQVRVRFYLNAERSCWVNIKPSTYW